jgi:hypothetical protein
LTGLTEFGLKQKLDAVIAVRGRREKAEGDCLEIFSSDPGICIFEDTSTMTREPFEDGFWSLELAVRMFRIKSGETLELSDRRIYPIVNKARFRNAARKLQFGPLIPSQGSADTAEPQFLRNPADSKLTPFQGAVGFAILNRRLQKRPGGAVFTAAALRYPDGRLPTSPAAFRDAVMAADALNLGAIVLRSSSWNRWLKELEALASRSRPEQP